MEIARRNFMVWLLVYPAYFVFFGFLHEAGHALAALSYGDSVTVGLNNTLYTNPEASHLTIAFHLAGPIITLTLALIGLFIYTRKPHTAPSFFSVMCIVNALNRIGPLLAYYAGVLDRQDELHAGLFLVNGRLVMNYAEALEAYTRTPDYYFDNPLYHIFAITSLTLSATILYIFAKNAREPFTNHRRLTIISIILVTVASVLLLRVIDPLIRIRLG